MSNSKDFKNPEKTQKLDPFAAREAQKYENPIPSREFLLAYIEERGKPLSFKHLAMDLDLVDDAKEALRRRLKAMERDGQLVKNRKGAYGLIGNMGLVKGRFSAHRDGYGFVIPSEDDGAGDLYINNREAGAVFHDDEVVAKVTGIDAKGRREGIIIEITQRNTSQVVGRFFETQRAGVVEPAGKVKKSILIPDRNTDVASRVQDGQFVLINIIQQPTKHTQALGEIIEILGDHMAPGMETDVAIHSYQLPNFWSPEVLQELDQIPDEIQEKDLAGRKDLRALPLVTIDGEDSRDFDDAVYCQATKSGWRLYVAIADVSHYVKPNTALDKEAYERGTSVYFPNKVIPMLPEKLSNGLCSLNPKVDRLCMVADMHIDRLGKITRSTFYPAVMHSKARLTYTQVGRFLEESQHGAVPKELHTAILALNNLYQVLKNARDKRGAIDMDITETRIVFGDDKKIEKILPTQRNVAHRIIEEAMLCANVAAARVIERNKLINLFRVHGTPNLDKVEKLRGFVGDLGLRFTSAEEPTPKDYSDLLSLIKGRPDSHIITLVLLRTLSQAVYTPENMGHFGLAFKAYAHFTSPIRRYPDLLIHRGIKAFLEKKNACCDLEHMEALGHHCSAMERRADEASRDVMDWLKCEFMLDKVGQEYDGVISSVVQFGLFIELKNIYVEGLVHVNSLEGDYYIHDAVRHLLIGERTRVKYKLGDSIRVRVKNVNLDERKIDFEIVAIDKSAKSAKLTKPVKSGKATKAVKIKKISKIKKTKK